MASPETRLVVSDLYHRYKNDNSAVKLDSFPQISKVCHYSKLFFEVPMGRLKKAVRNKHAFLFFTLLYYKSL